MTRKFSKIATYELSLIITIENKQITFMLSMILFRIRLALIIMLTWYKITVSCTSPNSKYWIKWNRSLIRYNLIQQIYLCELITNFECLHNVDKSNTKLKEPKWDLCTVLIEMIPITYLVSWNTDKEFRKQNSIFLWCLNTSGKANNIYLLSIVSITVSCFQFTLRDTIPNAMFRTCNKIIRILIVLSKRKEKI